MRDTESSGSNITSHDDAYPPALSGSQVTPLANLSEPRLPTYQRSRSTSPLPHSENHQRQTQAPISAAPGFLRADASSLTQWMGKWISALKPQSSDEEQPGPRSYLSKERSTDHPEPSHALSRPHSIATSDQWSRGRHAAILESQPFWLALYFIFNLGLTLFNKYVLVKFPFPYTLTAMHALFGTVGCYVLQEQGFFTPARLSTREQLTLTTFSVLYTVNIAVSNLSLQLVTVPFHQVVRASSPLFTIILARFMTGTQISLIKLLTLLPVVAGVGFTTYGDYYFTFWGLVLTLFGTFLAALKTIVTNMLQSGTTIGSGVPGLSTNSRSGIKLHPLDLLMRMSPLAFIQCVLYGWASGELDRVQRFGALEMDKTKAVALAMNGMIAFGLNVVSFTANKKAGPLTMNVAANVKQVLTMLLAVYLFDLVITATNMVGILLTLGGGAWYAAIEYREKQKKRAIIAMTSLDRQLLHKQ